MIHVELFDEREYREEELIDKKMVAEKLPVPGFS